VRISLLSLLLIAALAAAGCGGDDSGAQTQSTGALSGSSTCNEWIAAEGAKGTADKNAYLAGQQLEVGSGTPGEAISLWIDSLCGKGGVTTPYSSLTPISEVFPQAKQRFDGGETLPPAPPDDGS
jgi:hypothetical protein